MSAQTKNRGGHHWNLQIKRECDVLFQATEGVGVSALYHTLCSEAVIADNGSLKDSQGNAGYAWDPESHSGNNDPVRQRVLAASASLGRIMSGGHPTHRVYEAFLEAIYQVTVTQDYDVTERIERLWALQEQHSQEEQETTLDRRPAAWRRLLSWLTAWWHRTYEEEA